MFAHDLTTRRIEWTSASSSKTYERKVSCARQPRRARRTSSNWISGFALALFSSARLPKEKNNRHVRFVLNRSTKLQLECINQLGDCQSRTWVVFHGGLERTRSVSGHVTELESYRRSFPSVANSGDNKTVAIVEEGQKDKESAKSFSRPARDEPLSETP